jgi:hypothetical protein
MEEQRTHTQSKKPSTLMEKGRGYVRGGKRRLEGMDVGGRSVALPSQWSHAIAAALWAVDVATESRHRVMFFPNYLHYKLSQASSAMVKVVRFEIKI